MHNNITQKIESRLCTYIESTIIHTLRTLEKELRRGERERRDIKVKAESYAVLYCGSECQCIGCSYRFRHDDRGVVTYVLDQEYKKKSFSLDIYDVYIGNIENLR